MQDLELMEENTANITHAVIVGGGLIGVEMAEMLHSRDIPVTYLIQRKALLEQCASFGRISNARQCI